MILTEEQYNRLHLIINDLYDTHGLKPCVERDNKIERLKKIRIKKFYEKCRIENVMNRFEEVKLRGKMNNIKYRR